MLKEFWFGGFLKHFEYVTPLFLACKISTEESAYRLKGFLSYMTICFSLIAFKSLLVLKFWHVDYSVAVFGFILFGTLWDSWIWMPVSFLRLGKFLAIISSSKCSAPPFFFFLLCLGPLYYKCCFTCYCPKGPLGFLHF